MSEETQLPSPLPSEQLIKIVVSKGVPYIWNPEDWLKLRTEYRIMGHFDGAAGSGWTGPILINLPLKLSDVETKYLVTIGVAETFEIPRLSSLNIPVDENKFKALRSSRRYDQLEQLKKKRKADIESMVDKIIEGKRKSGRSLVPDKETVIQDELAKIINLPFEVIQIDLKDPWIHTKDDFVPYEFPFPTTQIEKLRFRVFEDFHLNRKYFITSGLKFGGDYLAYPGDPANHHAEFIIMCEDDSRRFHESHIRSQARLAHIVKKTLLVAFIDQNSNALKYKPFVYPSSSSTTYSETLNRDHEDEYM